MTSRVSRPGFPGGASTSAGRCFSTRRRFHPLQAVRLRLVLLRVHQRMLVGQAGISEIKGVRTGRRPADPGDGSPGIGRRLHQASKCFFSMIGAMRSLRCHPPPRSPSLGSIEVTIELLDAERSAVLMIFSSPIGTARVGGPVKHEDKQCVGASGRNSAYCASVFSEEDYPALGFNLVWQQREAPERHSPSIDSPSSTDRGALLGQFQLVDRAVRSGPGVGVRTKSMPWRLQVLGRTLPVRTFCEPLKAICSRKWASPR